MDWTVTPETDWQAALDNPGYDALVVVAPGTATGLSVALDAFLAAAASVDQGLSREPCLLQSPEWPGSRLVFAPLPDLQCDCVDVRCVAESAGEAVRLSLRAGARRPLLCLAGLAGRAGFADAAQVAVAGVAKATWQPLEARRSQAASPAVPEQLGLFAPGLTVDAAWSQALEQGRCLARDLAGTEPEAMAPPGFADYCAAAFAGGPVEVRIDSEPDHLLREYPLLMAVARASLQVARHRPQVIRLAYHALAATRTLFLVGKAVTYDTGGADIKVGGHMAGMSRDKGGGAAVAGFMRTLAELAPPDLSVIALIGAVRNSIGADAFVADEIITARSGRRVRIGNTDAEGRLVMADLLTQLREEALEAVAPTLFTVATLTGHAALCHGPYSAYVENPSARRQGIAARIVACGDAVGDPGEVMRLRREDWQQNRARSAAEDLVSSNPGPSVGIKRGHQFPAAFLSAVSGLDEHGLNADTPLPFCHIDIAGSATEQGDWQFGKPTGAPLMALAGAYLRRQDDRGFGTWRDAPREGLDYQRGLRDEWET